MCCYVFVSCTTARKKTTLNFCEGAHRAKTHNRTRSHQGRLRAWLSPPLQPRAPAVPQGTHLLVRLRSLPLLQRRALPAKKSGFPHSVRCTRSAAPGLHFIEA